MPQPAPRGPLENTPMHPGCRWPFVVLLFLVSRAAAGDWPQILGPHRNGTADDERISHAWPSSGPPVKWQHRVGEGFAGVAVAQGRVVVFHRVGNEEVVEARDADTGESLWETSYPTPYTSGISPDSGPRCVPLIHEGDVYVFGAAGRLSRVSLASGRVVWSRDTRADFRAPEGYFGAGSSPIVEGNRLLVNAGGREHAGIIAVSLETGETVWKATDDLASYSSPVATTVDGVRHVIFVTRLNVLSIDPADGSVRFRFPFGRRGPTVNAANPVVFDRHVFLSASYGVGAALLELQGDRAEVVWRDRQDVMSSQYMTSVYHEGVLYGVDGRADLGTCRLRALDPRTGTIFWTEEDFGMATMMLADNRLLILKSDGTLVAARPSRTAYHELARARLFDGTTRALPAIAGGKLYARDTRWLKCIDLSGDVAP